MILCHIYTVYVAWLLVNGVNIVKLEVDEIKCSIIIHAQTSSAGCDTAKAYNRHSSEWHDGQVLCVSFFLEKK